MSDKDISRMGFKELRNEVQLLRDELAIMQRKYEDMLYNLDSDNFSSTFKKEQDNMKSEVKLTAEGLNSIVLKSFDVKNAIEITELHEATDTTKVYKIPKADSDEHTYYYYNSHSHQWEEISDDTVSTMFSQTADGFMFKGNSIIDGKVTITKDLTLSGVITWDMSNSPVKTQYSTDNSTWHDNQVSGYKYMRMSFDGGKSWTAGTQIVGKDGSSASVTFNSVNNALGDLFKTWQGGTPTTITDSYIYSPKIKSGELYSCVIYAGKGAESYAKMSEYGLDVYIDGSCKIGMGYTSGLYDYPYLILGAGSNNAGDGKGCICKLTKGLWIGDASVAKTGGNTPDGINNATGIFIDLGNDTIYKYINGIATEL